LAGSVSGYASSCGCKQLMYSTNPVGTNAMRCCYERSAEVGFQGCID
jgi:hypothetical protein